MSEDEQTEKERMLDYLDEIRRRVACEDVVGFTLLAITDDATVLNRRGGDTSDPFFILVETEIAATHRAEFMEDNRSFDEQRRPRLNAADEDSEE